MAKSNKIIPHWIFPSFWGLAGKTKERAVAEYYFEGEELELAIAKIDIDDSVMLLAKELEIKKSYDTITEKEYDYGIAEIRNDEGTWLGVRHKHGEITDVAFCKAMATLRDEPWVDYTKVELNKTTGSIESFELDWNEQFIKVIREEGFNAISDEDCVDLWLTKMSRNFAMETLQGTGVFDEESEVAYESKKQRLQNGKTIYR